jgi:hypothetical protein
MTGRAVTGEGVDGMEGDGQLSAAVVAYGRSRLSADTGH